MSALDEIFIKEKLGAREMARPLRTLVALQRMWVQFPTPTWWFITITICSPFSRGFVPSNVLFRYQAHGCTNMNSGKTSIHKTKKEKLWLTGSLGHVIFVFEMFRNLFKFSQKEEQPAWWVSWHYRVFGRDGVNVSSVTHHSTSLVEVALVTSGMAVEATINATTDLSLSYH